MNCDISEHIIFGIREIWCEIFELLDIQNLGRAAQTNVTFNNFIVNVPIYREIMNSLAACTWSTTRNRRAKSLVNILLGACKMNYLKLVVNLCEKYEDQIANYLLPCFMMASLHGHIDVVKYLQGYIYNFKYLINKINNEIKIQYHDFVRFTNSVSDRALYFACFSGNSELLQLLINFGGNADNEIDGLCVALAFGYTNIVKCFCSNRLYLNTNDNMVSFHLACEYGLLDVIKFFISRGVNINGTGYYRHYFCPVYCACINGHFDVVKYLVEQGANIRNGNPLELACEKGYFDIVKYLVEKGANIHHNNDFALEMALKNGDPNIVDFLVTQGADLHAKIKNVMGCVSQHGKLDMVKYLFRKGVNIFDHDHKLLQWAYEQGNLATINFLLKCGEKITNVTPDLIMTISIGWEKFLFWALKNNYAEVAEYLVLVRKDIDRYAFVILIWACHFGYIDLVKYFYTIGASGNSDIFNELLFYKACENGHLHVIQFLVEHDFQLKKIVEENTIYFKIACFNGRMDMIKFFLDHGVKIRNYHDLCNGYVNSRDSVLGLVCKRGYLDVAKFLIEAKENDNIKENNSNEKYVHEEINDDFVGYAIAGRQIAVAKYLLERLIYNYIE